MITSSAATLILKTLIAQADAGNGIASALRRTIDTPALGDGEAAELVVTTATRTYIDAYALLEAIKAATAADAAFARTAEPDYVLLDDAFGLEPEYGDLRPSELEEASPVEPDPKIASRPATAPPAGEIMPDATLRDLGLARGVGFFGGVPIEEADQ